MMPTALLVIFSSILSGSMLNVTGSMSTKTGVPPVRTIAPAVAKNVKDGAMISSPGFTLSAIRGTIRASEPELTPMALLAPV